MRNIVVRIYCKQGDHVELVKELTDDEVYRYPHEVVDRLRASGPVHPEGGPLILCECGEPVPPYPVSECLNCGGPL